MVLTLLTTVTTSAGPPSPSDYWRWYANISMLVEVAYLTQLVLIPGVKIGVANPFQQILWWRRVDKGLANRQLDPEDDIPAFNKLV